MSYYFRRIFSSAVQIVNHYIHCSYITAAGVQRLKLRSGEGDRGTGSNKLLPDKETDRGSSRKKIEVLK